MAAKVLSLFVLAVIVSLGYSLTEYRLDDVSRTYQSNPLLGMGIAIPKWFEDTLESCYAILPDGMMVEAYPTDRIPYDTVSFSYAAQPFTTCGIAFRNTPVSLSGTYELLSLVFHRANSSQTLARQRFHITITELGSLWQGEKI